MSLSNGDKVWNHYIDKYGKEPDNSQQLQNYAKGQSSLTNLNYKSARNTFNENEGKGLIVIDGVKSSKQTPKDKEAKKESKSEFQIYADDEKKEEEEEKKFIEALSDEISGKTDKMDRLKTRLDILDRIHVTNDNLSETKAKINKDSGVDLDTIDLNVGDDILRVDDRYYHCKADDIAELNNDLKVKGHPNAILRQRMNEYPVLAVFGDDTRIRITPTTSPPYPGICLLAIKWGAGGDGKSIGSGWIYRNSINAISDYTLVVTAGHNLVDKGIFATEMVITPGPDGPTPGPDLSFKPVNDILFTTLNQIKFGADGSYADDYGAILINKSAITNVNFQFDFYEGLVVGSSLPVTLAGYPIYYDGSPTVLTAGKMYLAGGNTQTFKESEDGDGILCSYTFDTTIGQSGSPVWCMQDSSTVAAKPYGYFRVIGIHNHSAGSRYNTNIATSSSYVQPNIERWIQPRNAPKDYINTTSQSGYTLHKKSKWTIYSDELMADPGKIVIGASLLKMGTDTLGLKIICCNLNGTGYDDSKQTSGDSTFSIDKDDDKYFSTQMLSAPNGKVVVGAALYKIESQHIGLKIKCANPNGSDVDNNWTEGSGNDFNAGKNSDCHAATSDLVTDINYTAVTAMGLSKLYNQYIGLSLTTNVFYS